MKYKSFEEFFEEARKHLDFWVEGAILEVTEELYRKMEELGLTKSELARRVGTSPAYVTKVFRGDANFTLKTIVKFARALESDVRFHLAPHRSITYWFDDVSWTPRSSPERYSATVHRPTEPAKRQASVKATVPAMPVGRLSPSNADQLHEDEDASFPLAA